MTAWVFLGWCAALWAITAVGIVTAGHAIAYSVRQVYNATTETARWIRWETELRDLQP